MAGQKYTDAKQACSNFVQNLNFSTNADQAGLASYNSSATLDQRLTNNPQALNLGIQSLPGAGGNTSISSGLRTGQTELASTRHNPQALPVMVLLSDGLPTGSDSPSNALYTATQAKNAGTLIFAGGLGSDVDPVLMQGIASSPNDYFFTTNSSQLSALFDAISTVICRPPTNIIGPSNLTVCAGSTATFRVTASGCSSFSYQWNKDGVRINGQTSNTLVLTNVPVSAAGLYAVEVTSACRSATNSATLTVTPPPAINCSENKTVEAGSAWSFDMPTANYEVTVKETVTNQTGACAFIATRTWQTKDPCQNSAQCSQQVTVVDTTAPVIVCSSNLVLAANAGRRSRSNVAFVVTATDNCGPPTVVSIPPSGSTFPVGVTEVTNTATDSHGNSSACTFTVTIYDTENPIIHCPTNLVLSADAGQCGRSNVTFSVTANDNCGSVQVVSVPASGSSFPIGVTMVTNVASDSHGNSSACPFTLTIQDTEFPSITCPLDKTIEEGNPWTFDEPIVSDNCGTPVVTFTTHTNLICGNGFSAVRTWTAVDSSGNTATCSQTVNLVDTTAPTVSITSPTNGTVFLAPALVPLIADAQDVNGIIARVEFFSGADKIGQTTNGPQYFIILTNVPAGEYTFTARATDICGNVGTSAPVHISVLTSLPLTVNGPIKLNFQTGFFEQIAHVTNPTPFVLSAVGVLAYNLPTAWRVQNTRFLSHNLPGVFLHR